MQQVTNKPSSSYYITPNKTNKYMPSLEYIGGVSAGIATFSFSKMAFRYLYRKTRPDFETPRDFSNEINKAKKIANLDNIEIFDTAKLSDMEIKNSDGSVVIKTARQQLIEEYKKATPSTKRPFYQKSISQKFLSKFKFYKDIQTKVYYRNLDDVIKGKNAFYVSDLKEIFINIKEAGSAAFHEMGHQININNPILKANWKLKHMLQNQKLLMPLLLLTAFSTNKRTPKNPPQTKLQKTTNFVKENIGKIVFALSIPQIIDEVFASIHGQKLAKQVMPKDLMKCVTKSHIGSAASYISYAIAMGLMAFGANKVRDIYVDKMREKCKHSFTNQQI